MKLVIDSLVWLAVALTDSAIIGKTLCVGAFALGAVPVPLTLWLWCVYPYSQVSLKWPLIWLAAGFVASVVAVAAYLALWALMWPGD